MHLPDGLLGNASSAPLIGAAVLAIAHSINKLRSGIFKKKVVQKRKLALAEGDIDSSSKEKWSLSSFGKRKLIEMAIIGSFIFAIQMIDFSVGIGTGHFIGAALAAIVLGPYLGIVLMSVVLILQAFLLADGGIMALGANIVNMAIVGSLVGYFVYSKIKKPFVGIFLAGFLSVFVMSVLFGIYLLISTGDIGMIGNFIGIHLIIGILEGALTLILIRVFFSQLIKR